jgi:hypothetical protein
MSTKSALRVASEAENIIDAVVLRPLHGLDATVMTVAAPHDAGVRHGLPAKQEALIADMQASMRRPAR